MNTLNYWLGKLQRLQLFGHGVLEIQVRTSSTQYIITDVSVLDGVVVITVKE